MAWRDLINLVICYPGSFLNPTQLKVTLMHKQNGCFTSVWLPWLHKSEGTVVKQFVQWSVTTTRAHIILPHQNWNTCEGVPITKVAVIKIKTFQSWQLGTITGDEVEIRGVCCIWATSLASYHQLHVRLQH